MTVVAHSGRIWTLLLTLAAAVALSVAAPRPARAASLVQVTGFGNNPTNLQMHLYVPDRLAARPGVLFVLHGCQGTGPYFYSSTEFHSLADQYGFIVIYPSTSPSGSCWDVSSDAALTHNGGSDPAGLLSMLAYVQARYPVDASRVFVTGGSSGAMMTNVLLGAYPDVFKGGAAFMGVPFHCFYTGTVRGWNGACAGGQTVKTPQQWGDLVRAAYPGYTGPRPRMQLFHGTADTTLNYNNLAEEMKQWTNVLGVTQTPSFTDTPQSGWTRTRYGGTGVQPPTETVSVAGAGHVLPLTGQALMAVRFFGLDQTSSGTTYVLTVTRTTGTGGGNVTSTPAGINCGSTCSASYNSGTAVTLTAAPTSGSMFAGWSGACTGTGTCIVTMTAAQSVTATFTAVQQQGGPISINAGGAATGTFVADVDFSGGSTYSTTSAIDTSLITGTAGTVPPQAVFQTERYGAFTYTIPGLTAGGTYAVTLYFAESYWTAAGQRSFNVAINGAAALTAFDIFAAAGGANKAVARTFNTTASSSGQVVIAFTAGSIDNPKVSGIAVAPGNVSTGYSLTVTKAGTGTGTVAGGAINCGSTCSAANLASGTTVTLTATPATGSTFAGWSGACVGTGSCIVTLTASQTVTATFNTSGTSACKAVTGGQSGNFNTTGAICFTVTGTINGWGCSNVDGRTVTVNGAAASCGQAPLPGSSPYTFSFSAGAYNWASFYWW